MAQAALCPFDLLFRLERLRDRRLSAGRSSHGELDAAIAEARRDAGALGPTRDACRIRRRRGCDRCDLPPG